MKKLIFALALIVLLVPMVAYACPSQLQLTVTATTACVGPTPTYSVSATATQSWNGYTLQGITGTGSGTFSGPTQAYSVTATWTKVNQPEHIQWGNWQSGHQHGPEPVEERWILFWQHRHGTVIPTTYYTETRNVSGTLQRPVCYVPCSIQNETGPVESAHTFTYGPFGTWADNGDGTFTRTRTGTEDWTLTYTSYDSQNPALVCGSRVVPMSLPASDSETADGAIRLSSNNTCAGWLELKTFYDPFEALIRVETDSGAYTLPFALETATSEFGTVFDEPAECEDHHGFEINIENNCAGFNVFYLNDGVVMEGLTFSAPWEHKNHIEKIAYPAVAGEVDGDKFSFPAGDVEEPADCLVCRKLYYMLHLEMAGGPDWYLDTGHDGDADCWVKLREPSQVATFRQADICSVCIHPDFIYLATNAPFGDWVYDCAGRIVYGDPEWKTEWYSKYEDNYCRQESCINK